MRKITLEEFWAMDKRNVKAGIHCDTIEKACKLLIMFDKIGERWRSGRRYTVENNWFKHGDRTVYENTRTFDDIDDAKAKEYMIFEFEDIVFLEDSTIKSVTLNDKKKITTVVFTDGDVKMVKCGENDTYSPEMGIVYCMALKYSGLSKTQFKKMLSKFLPKEKKV